MEVGRHLMVEAIRSLAHGGKSTELARGSGAQGRSLVDHSVRSGNLGRFQSRVDDSLGRRGDE